MKTGLIFPEVLFANTAIRPVSNQTSFDDIQMCAESG